MLTKSFITAGKAIFTVTIPAPFIEACKSKYDEEVKPWYTFRVTHKEANGNWPEAWFVSLLTGPDNSWDYSYVGMLNTDGTVKLTKASKYDEKSFPVCLIRKVISALWNNNVSAVEASGFDLHHEGKCCRCGRRLTVPESIESGIGPECATRMAI